MHLGQADRTLLRQIGQLVTPVTQTYRVAHIMDVHQVSPLQRMFNLVRKGRTNPAGQDDQKQEGAGERRTMRGRNHVPGQWEEANVRNPEIVSSDSRSSLVSFRHHLFKQALPGFGLFRIKNGLDFLDGFGWIPSLHQHLIQEGEG